MTPRQWPRWFADLWERVIPPRSYEELVRRDRPIAWWRLSEPDGATAWDASGQGNHAAYMGTVTRGVDAIPGVPGGAAARFHGRADYTGCVVPPAARLDGLLNDLTVEVWFRTLMNGAPIAQVLGHTNLFLARFNLGRWPPLNAWKVTKYAVSDIFLGTVPTDTNWHHVALVYSRTAGTLLYQDGRLAGYDPDARDLEPSRPFPAVGMAECGIHEGDLAEVAVYDRVLAPERIAAHYRMGAGL